jgi:hypothetical protein
MPDNVGKDMPEYKLAAAELISPMVLFSARTERM